jgi:hypothetical protein
VHLHLKSVSIIGRPCEADHLARCAPGWSMRAGNLRRLLPHMTAGAGVVVALDWVGSSQGGLRSDISKKDAGDSTLACFAGYLVGQAQADMAWLDQISRPGRSAVSLSASDEVAALTQSLPPKYSRAPNRLPLCQRASIPLYLDQAHFESLGHTEKQQFGADECVRPLMSTAHLETVVRAAQGFTAITTGMSSGPAMTQMRYTCSSWARWRFVRKAVP